MTLLITLHGDVAYAVLIVMAVLAGVSGYYLVTRRTPARGLLTLMWVGEALVVVQAVLGALLWLPGLRTPNDFHYLYGLLVPLVIPAFYAAGRRDRRLLSLWLLLAALIVLGMGLRSFATAGRPLLPGL
ncbi:MAG: hypothetical protein KIS91_06925 [Anaerolineae bacterium]|nr:hypothetical protein [Anaerolineae bacterium]